MVPALIERARREIALARIEIDIEHRALELEFIGTLVTEHARQLRIDLEDAAVEMRAEQPRRRALEDLAQSRELSGFVR